MARATGSRWDPPSSASCWCGSGAGAARGCCLCSPGWGEECSGLWGDGLPAVVAVLPAAPAALLPACLHPHLLAHCSPAVRRTCSSSRATTMMWLPQPTAQMEPTWSPGPTMPRCGGEGGARAGGWRGARCLGNHARPAQVRPARPSLLSARCPHSVPVTRTLHPACSQVKVWTLSNGFCFVTFADHQAPVTAVQFLPRCDG